MINETVKCERSLAEIRRAWRYQRGNQNPYIEGQTTQWPKEKSTKGQQRSTNIHIKLKIEQHEPHYKPGVNSGSPEGLAVPVPLG